MDPPPSFPPMPFQTTPMTMSSIQFRPSATVQQAQQFIPAPTQPHSFQPIGIGRGVAPVNGALPPGPPQQFYSQPMQHFPQRAGQPLPFPVAPHTANGFNPSNPGPGMPLSSSYTFAPSFGHIQRGFGDNNQYPVVPQMHAPIVSTDGQMMISSTENSSSVSVNSQQSVEQPSTMNISAPVSATQTNIVAEALSDWREHTSSDGRKYYYNRRTRLSSWEKPIELMTATERADASTNWKEFTSPDGKKYYYNKVTRESKWVIPEELKLAREVSMNASEEMPQNIVVTSSATEPTSSLAVEPSSNADAPSKPDGSTPNGGSSESVSVSASGERHNIVVLGTNSSPAVASITEGNAEADHKSVTPSTLSTSNTAVESVGTTTNAVTELIRNSSTNATQDKVTTSDVVSTHHKEDASNDAVGDKTEDVAPDDKSVDRESLVYANKTEAKSAFMSLLEFANVGSDWNWDRAMRVIINDKRYGALKTLGERKQVFNEFLGQKKKQDAEERRSRQKRAREEFKKMLEESTEVTISTRWSKAEVLFENDERFKAVERDRERRDIYDHYIEERVKEEHAKAHEEQKRHIVEYKRFLESCDFIKANSQWRRVQDRLEADERCSRLDKLVRLEVFQDYINDLEREEEEQRKIQKEEIRKVERKNRDEFRKLMDEHVASGSLTAKTLWRDYCNKVKELPAYLAVVSNASGSTPKDLYDDVVEELEKQFDVDRTRIKNAVKLGKTSFSSTWTFEDFKVILNDIGSPTVSDVNSKMIYDELLERAKEKEEKEIKRRKRLKDDFSHLLSCIKEISSSSEWEVCKSILKHRQEYRSIGDENLCQEIFENYVEQLKEQAKERDQKRKDEKARKEKERDESERSKSRQRKDRESGRSREREDRPEKDVTDDETADLTTESKRSGKESSSNRRHRKRHHSSEIHEDQIDLSNKRSHESGGSHKKSRSHTSAAESDHEGRHRRHRRDQRHGSRRNGDQMDLEDGEFGNAVEDR